MLVINRSDAGGGRLLPIPDHTGSTPMLLHLFLSSSYRYMYLMALPAEIIPHLPPAAALFNLMMMALARSAQLA